MRALINDLTAHLMAVFAPPPGDMVMRVAMFRTWGIAASQGLAGATMNMLVFYVNRFAAPVVGLLVLLVFGAGTEHLLVAAVSGLVAVVIAVLVHRVVHSEGFAVRLGTAAGRVARRVRSSVDPATWAAATTEFQGHVSDRYRRGFPRSLLGLLAMVLCDALILLLTLRFVGVTADEVTAYEVIGTFLLAYPLTLPPFMGLGVYDLVLLGAFVEFGGDLVEPEVVAALTVWRAVTLVGPVLLGVASTAYWRSSSPAPGDAPPA
jgi:uncharacterized membrane protein YbhN (UPF0104 family)